MTTRYQTTQQDQLTAVFVAGNMAFWQGARYTTGNPHKDKDLAFQWGKGWLEAEADNKRDAQRYSPEAQFALDNAGRM